MKKLLCFFIASILCLATAGCHYDSDVEIAATTAPVYEFTTRICDGTGLSVGRIITENVSCLHDYSLKTSQMRMIENAQVVILSGAGLEDFFQDVLSSCDTIIDASQSITLLCSEEAHEENSTGHEHHHQEDPHIWLSPVNAKKMAENICSGLEKTYPQHTEQFRSNLQQLLSQLSQLETYGAEQLDTLCVRGLITFHDGFAYLADAFDLEILTAIEEEAGREASASEIIEICKLVEANNLPAIFTEMNSSVSASDIICAETGAAVYTLDMGMSGNGYFKAMYHNIDTIKEALG
jgi:ABC-type Zn uptake system ZnuABC Zn-binding protein ZnuA